MDVLVPCLSSSPGNYLRSSLLARPLVLVKAWALCLQVATYGREWLVARVASRLTIIKRHARARLNLARPVSRMCAGSRQPVAPRSSAGCTSHAREQARQSALQHIVGRRTRRKSTCPGRLRDSAGERFLARAWCFRQHRHRRLLYCSPRGGRARRAQCRERRLTVVQAMQLRGRIKWC